MFMQNRRHASRGFTTSCRQCWPSQPAYAAMVHQELDCKWISSRPSVIFKLNYHSCLIQLSTGFSDQPTKLIPLSITKTGRFIGDGCCDRRVYGFDLLFFVSSRQVVDLRFKRASSPCFANNPVKRPGSMPSSRTSISATLCPSSSITLRTLRSCHNLIHKE